MAILETPHNLDIFLDELMSETGSWVSMPTTAEPEPILDELERALSEIETSAGSWSLCLVKSISKSLEMRASMIHQKTRYT